MKLNNKGFSLVELLAVVVILGILVAFMYPNVNRLINENNEKNYEKLKTTIESAAKMYISDYKYKIVLDGEEITSINGQEIDESKIPISILVSEGNIKTTKENVIINPQNKEQCLNLEQSYIKVTYNNEGKDFIYGYYESDSEEIKNSKLYLKWDSKKVEDSNGDLVLNRNCLANISLVKYNIHLDDQEATIAGTTKIYGKNPGVFI